MSTKNDSDLPAIGFNVTESYEKLFLKTKAAFQYVYQNHFEDADWFLKADDDTFVFVENLKLLLSSHSPSSPLFFGCEFNSGYTSGGAGYVLSKEALRRLVTEAFENATGIFPSAKDTCSRDEDTESEDIQVAKCLHSVNATIGDSRDDLKRPRFFPFTPEHHLIKGGVNGRYDWYNTMIKYRPKEGMEGVSNTTITFHYVTPSQMYVLEFLIYRLIPFGYVPPPPPPPPPPPAEKVEESDSLWLLFELLQLFF